MEGKFYTYRHVRPDTGEVFYVGKGQKGRAKSRHQRSKHWNYVVEKNLGVFIVEIVTNNLIHEDAILHEIYLISFYGRKDLGKGTLVNFTDGGEGSPGTIVSEATRKLKSDKAKGRVLGPPMTKEGREKLPKQYTGVKLDRERVMRGVEKRCKKVINIETQIIYNSIKEAAQKEKRSKSWLSEVLSGVKRNTSKLRLYKKI